MISVLSSSNPQSNKHTQNDATIIVANSGQIVEIRFSVVGLTGAIGIRLRQNQYVGAYSCHRWFTNDAELTNVIPLELNLIRLVERLVGERVVEAVESVQSNDRWRSLHDGVDEWLLLL